MERKESSQVRICVGRSIHIEMKEHFCQMIMMMTNAICVAFDPQCSFKCIWHIYPFNVSMLFLHPYARFIIFRLSMIKLMSRVSDEAQHNDIQLNTFYIHKNM